MQQLTRRIARRPEVHAEEAPFDRVASAVLDAAAAFPQDRRSASRARQRVIDADLRLRERELLKLDHLVRAIAATLEALGVEAVTAGLAADQGVAVFRIALTTWFHTTGTVTWTDPWQHRFTDPPPEPADPAPSDLLDRDHPDDCPF